MSVKLMAAVWEHGPENSTERFVLLTLANYANDAGAGAYPSFATIAKRCAVSRRTAIRAVESLADAGYLVRVRRTKDGRFTSSEYRINPRRLVSDGDTMSPSDGLMVTYDHQGSDTVSPGWCHHDTRVVTQCHQGSDTVSPNPLSDPLIDPLEEGEGPRATTAQTTQARKKSPSPPVVKAHADRTPGGSGYRPPPEPEQALTPERARIGDMANAITEVTGVSARLNWPEVGSLAEELLAGGYMPTQLREHYAVRKTAGKWHWYEMDWRGKPPRSERPSLRAIRETIAGAVAYRSPEQVEQENRGQSWIERSLALARANGMLPQPQTG